MAGTVRVARVQRDATSIGRQRAPSPCMRSQSQAELDPLGSGRPHSPHPLIPRMTFNLSKGSLSIRSGFRLKRKQAWKTKSPSHAKKMKISFVLAAASSCWPSTQESGLLSQRYIPETGPEGSGESGHGYGSPRSPHVRDQMPRPFLGV